MPKPVNTDTNALRQSAQFLHKAYPGTSAQVTAAADEVDRLRAVIDKAPHQWLCRAVDADGALVNIDSCTCWKADVL